VTVVIILLLIIVFLLSFHTLQNDVVCVYRNNIKALSSIKSQEGVLSYRTSEARREVGQVQLINLLLSFLLKLKCDTHSTLMNTLVQD